MPERLHDSSTTVAIVGGGIGGLSAAAFLAQKGYSVTVFEQAPALAEVGAGLVIAPNAVRLLRRMGVLDSLTQTAVRLEVGWEFRRWDNGDILSAENLQPRCRELYGEDTFVAHRADLLASILSAVPADSLRLGSRVLTVEGNDERTVLTLDDGSRHVADILIGADGMHSIVRDAVTEPARADYSGLCAYRSLVAAERAPEFAKRASQTLWLGPKRHLVHYPISGGRYINLVAFAPAGDYVKESWSATAEIAELQAEFHGWDPRLQELLSKADRPGRWALLDRPPLSRWSDGRITLLGDAAHPMFPFFAQGAAQSIEDAAVLADAVSQNRADPTLALSLYEQSRIARTTALQNLSHERKITNHLPDGAEQQQRDATLAETDPLVQASWIYSYDPAKNVQEGIEA